MGHYALPTEPQPLPNDLFVIESLETCLTHKRGITMTNDVCIKRFFSELNPNKSDENRFRNGSRKTSSTIMNDLQQNSDLFYAYCAYTSTSGSVENFMISNSNETNLLDNPNLFWPEPWSCISGSSEFESRRWLLYG